MADFQEPEVEICASMLDALNECVQVCTSIYEVGVCIISNKMHFFFNISFYPWYIRCVVPPSKAYFN